MGLAHDLPQNLPHNLSKTPAGYRVRPAGPADDADIQALFALTLQQANWLRAGARIGDGIDNDIDTDFKRNSSGETVWVCTAPGQPLLGFVAVYAPGAFVHHLYVAPEAQRSGVGRALVDSLALWCPKPWRLKCVVANTAALAFYARTGWVEVERAMGSQGPYVLLRRL